MLNLVAKGRIVSIGAIVLGILLMVLGALANLTVFLVSGAVLLFFGGGFLICSFVALALLKEEPLSLKGVLSGGKPGRKP